MDCPNRTIYCRQFQPDWTFHHGKRQGKALATELGGDTWSVALYCARTLMKASGYIAVSVCVLLAFTFLQGITWPVRQMPDWQPDWWQCHTWANAGHVLSLPAMVPALVLENCGIFNRSVILPAIALGMLVETASISLVVYFVARRWLELYDDG